MDHDPGKADRNAISALLDCFFDPGNTNSSLSDLQNANPKSQRSTILEQRLNLAQSMQTIVLNHL